MAQIQFLRSTTPSQRPSGMVPGQIAFNLADKLLFVGDGSSNITDKLGDVVGSTAAGAGFKEFDLAIDTALSEANAYTDAAVADLVASAPALLNTLQELSAALADDPNFATTLSNSIAALAGDLSDEIARATAAEASLAADLSTETSRAQSAESTLTSNLASETSARQSADSTLQSNIDSEEAARIASDTTLQGNIEAEESARISAVSAVQSNIDGVAGDLAAETAARESADLTLQSNIDSVAASLVSETNNRTDADTLLQDNISGVAADLATEISDRQSADNTLQGNIDVVSSDLSTVTSNLATEITDRQNADIGLQNNIDAEASDRAAADVVLQTNIDAVDNAVSAEQSRAQNAESALDDRLVDVESHIGIIETVVFENDSNIYGASVAPVQDPDHREGWYYVSDGVNDAEWTLLDTANINISVAGAAAYVIMTLDSLAVTPTFDILTKPTGTNDVAPGLYHSAMRYAVNTAGLIAGKKYLFTFNNQVDVHPELEHVALTYQAINSELASDFSWNEWVKNIFIRGEGPADDVEFVLHAAAVGGFNSAPYETKTEIRKATVADLNQDFGTF